MAEKKTNNPRKTLAEIAKASASKALTSRPMPSDSLSEEHPHASESVSADTSATASSEFSEGLPESEEDVDARKEADSSRLDEIFAIDEEDALDDGLEKTPSQELPEPEKARKTRKSHSKDDQRVKREKSRHRWKIIRNVFLICLAVILVGIVVAFAVFRWGVSDDVTDIEGVWKIEGSTATVTIDEGRFVLTDDIAYKYEIDPVSKTIEFGFGNLSGSARYRFSADRNMLSIEDGEFDGASNLIGDIPWTFDMLIGAIQGNDPKDPKLSDESMTLKRVG